jgi:Cu+-exporting ATPase
MSKIPLRSDRANEKDHLTTTFLVPYIHCPSCVAYIESALSILTPRPTALTCSIVTHSVVVTHSPELLVETITKAIEDAGYDVESVAPDVQQAIHIAKQRRKNQKQGKRWLGFIFGRQEEKSAEQESFDRHVEHCAVCRAEAEEEARIAKEREEQGEKGGLHSPVKSEREGDDKPAPLTSVSADTAEKTYQLSVSIGGMTCSSCVNTVTDALKEQPWVKSVEVNLLSNSAVVVVAGDKKKETIEVIEDIGYDATVEDMKEKNPDDWQASFAIGGMTCASCVGNISEAIKDLSFVKSVDVNLLSNSAVVKFEGKNHIKDLQEAIEDVGYDAQLDALVEAGAQIRDERTVSIKVEGSYCKHCPKKVENALAKFDSLKIEKPMALGDNVISVSYKPAAPGFTIRHILQAIAAADDAFHPVIYHPMTLEDRSQAMHARERRHILLRVVLSVIVAIPTFIISIVFGSLVSSSNAIRQYFNQPLGANVSRMNWALFILATPVYFFAADLFHRRAMKELYALWRPGSKTPILRRFYRFGSMNMLLSFGTTIAYFSSIAQLILTATRNVNTGSSYFDSVVFLTMFLLFGRFLEAYSKAKTGNAISALAKLRPKTAVLVEGKDVRQIDVDLLEMGDIVRVTGGGSPPSDGIVIDGVSKFDESSLTGESKPVGKEIGDSVYSGTINREGPVSIRITEVGGSTMLDQIIRVVREGQTQRAPIERVADVLTGYFVPFVTLIAVLTWIIWVALGQSGRLPNDYLDVQVGGWPYWSLQFAISVFIVACPCGIGLAAPTALFVGGGLAAKYGILVKGGGEAFQEASGLDIVVFDKTGTLTEGGEPQVTEYEHIGGEDEKLALGIAKALEESSSHPVSRAVVAFCKDQETVPVNVKSTDEIPGRGMTGTFIYNDKRYEALVGNEALMTENGVEISTSASHTLDTWKAKGKSVVLVALKSDKFSLTTIFAASDPLRAESKAVIKALQNRGVDVWMISGDNPTTANAVGVMVGIPLENVIAGVLPEQKADKIKYLQSTQKAKSRSFLFGAKKYETMKRATVAMVGDGINDSPALTVADVGIAIGSGSDVAVSSAEFVLISPSLTSLLILVDLSRTVFRRIKFNFAWALVYNVVALPIAAGVLYPVVSNGNHVRLDPVWASLAMALSSVSVICSSLIMRTRIPGAGFRPGKLAHEIDERAKQKEQV